MLVALLTRNHDLYHARGGSWLRATMTMAMPASKSSEQPVLCAPPRVAKNWNIKGSTQSFQNDEIFEWVVTVLSKHKMEGVGGNDECQQENEP